MKMLFYFTTLILAHILREEKLAVPTTNATKEQEATLEVWNHFNFFMLDIHSKWIGGHALQRVFNFQHR